MPKSFKNVLETSLKTSKPILAFNIQNIQQLKALAVASKKNNKNIITQFSEKYFDLFSKNFDFMKIKKNYKDYNVHFFLDHCTDKEKIFFTEKDLNKLFIREGYTKENVEIFKTIYFDRNKFIKSYESFYNR